MCHAAVPHEESGRLDEALPDIGEVGREAAKKHHVDQRIRIPIYRWHRDAQAASQLGPR